MNKISKDLVNFLCGSAYLYCFLFLFMDCNIWFKIESKEIALLTLLFYTINILGFIFGSCFIIFSLVYIINKGIVDDN
jgi:hypothetical protein